MQVWPPLVANPQTLSWSVWDETGALGIPAVGRAVGLFQLAGVMELSAWRGDRELPQPRILAQPDLSFAGSARWVACQMADFVMSGNALSLVTARDSAMQPAAVRWAPAHRWGIVADGLGGIDSYWLNGVRVPREDVIHVARPVPDPSMPGRGLGVVEQHFRSLNRVRMQEDAESGSLQNGGVPSVAVISPVVDLTEEDANDAAVAWEQAFGGRTRRPGIFPRGTEIRPLSWSATDAQAIELRKMSLTDVANMFGMDPYWLGAPASSHTYRSPGQMWERLTRETLELPLSIFEDVWSQALLPRGQRVRFARDELTRDDLASNVRTAQLAWRAGLWTWEETRRFLRLDPSAPEPVRPSPGPLVASGIPQDTNNQPGGV